MTDLSFSRRGFLKATAAATGGFLVGWQWPAAAAPTGLPAAFNPFVRVDTDGTVTMISKHLDKGQGVTTGLTTLIAEEMDADWAQMRVDFAPADTATYKNLLFGVQGTGGSTAMANSWMQYRKAGAAARAMLVEAAAKRWGVDPGAIRIEAGRVRAGDREAGFGELAQAAAAVTPPSDPALKAPEAFRLIGQQVPRLDSPAKTDGSLTFPIDLQRDDLLVAVMAHPPRFGATLLAVDDTAARAVPGVVDVVKTPRGLGVIATGFWAATKGREALSLEWDSSKAETRSSAQMFADYAALAGRSGAKPARQDGDVDAALKAARVIEARFEFPFLAHAAMEPMDCVAQLHPDRCEIWTGSQLQTVDQQVVAGITGLARDQVIIHTQFAGGSFGRRAVPDSDYIADAVMIAKAHGQGRPIKLQWTREDDMRAGRYRPMSYHVMRGGLDKDGMIVAWDHVIVTQSYLKGTALEGSIGEDGIDSSAVEGARGLPYAIANLRVSQQLADNGVTGLWWRSVGHTHNAYATEVFLDMLADAAGTDPIALRRRLLKNADPRFAAVLERAVAEAGPAPEGSGQGRGVALHKSFNSFVAQVADVTVRDGRVAVDRVTCAVDCGIAINPDIVAAQMEGGIGYGLSAALREAITLTDGLVDQANFDRYQPLRIHEMPQVSVHIIASAEPPTGVGEPGTPPIAPAVANAIAQATGKRLTRLPFGDQLA